MLEIQKSISKKTISNKKHDPNTKAPRIKSKDRHPKLKIQKNKSKNKTRSKKQNPKTRSKARDPKPKIQNKNQNK